MKSYLGGLVTVALLWSSLDVAYALGKHEGMRQAIWTMKAFNAGMEAGTKRALN